MFGHQGVIRLLAVRGFRAAAAARRARSHGALLHTELGGEITEVHICTRHAALVLELINRQAELG